MSSVMPTGGLSLDQAPPLSIPSAFFLTISVGILAAGCILIATGAAALSTPWAPQTLALAHAGTLGVLAMGMVGALYQMTPVIAGTPVPFTRIAHIVQALLLAGLAGFIWRLLGGPVLAMSAAILCFTIGLGAAPPRYKQRNRPGHAPGAGQPGSRHIDRPVDGPGIYRTRFPGKSFSLGADSPDTGPTRLGWWTDHVGFLAGHTDVLPDAAGQ